MEAYSNTLTRVFNALFAYFVQPVEYMRQMGCRTAKVKNVRRH